MKKLTALGLASFLILSLSACGTIDVEQTDENYQPEVVGEVSETETPAEEREPGDIGLDFPSTLETSAQVGENVLAPSALMLEDFLAAPEDTNIIFYQQTMKEVNTGASVLADFMGDEYTVPNSLIVPIPAGQVAEKGDLVLTWWQSGSGMKIALVLEGGAEPLVKYLDLGLERDPETLEADSFVKLTSELVPGAPVVVKDGDQYLFENAIGLSGDKILTEGWAGFMFVRPRENVKVIDLYDDYQEGDEVYMSLYGKSRAATVVSVNKEEGTLVVSHGDFGTPQEAEISVLELTRSLD